MTQPAEADLQIQRRRHERLPTDLRVRYGIAATDRQATVANVSLSGLFIRTNEPFKVGTRFQLVLEFPKRSFRMSAEVMWAIQVPEHQLEALIYGMGVQFVDRESAWPAFFAAWARELAARE